MKRNLQEYPQFYRWLTLPFARNPRRVQVLRRTNRILTLVMPGIYGLVFCWLCLKQTAIGGIWPFIWIPASGFILFSLFRHWINVPFFFFYTTAIPFFAFINFMSPRIDFSITFS